MGSPQLWWRFALCAGVLLALGALAGQLDASPSALRSSRDGGRGRGAGRNNRQEMLRGKFGGMSHYRTSDPYPDSYGHGALQGSHHLDWPHAGRSAQAAMDPLNGKALLVPDPKHPGYTVLSKDAKMRMRAYKSYLRDHPDSTPGMTLSNLDASSDPVPGASDGKLMRLGVNV